VPRCLLGVRYRPQQLGRNAIAPADDPHAHTIRDAARDFGHEIAPEETHQQANLSRRALPVVGRERIQRQCSDAAVGSGLDDFLHGARAGDVSGGSHLAACHGPAAVAVHDDRDVHAAWRVVLHD